MSHFFSNRRRSLRQNVAGPWTQLHTDWLHIPLPKRAGRAKTPSWEVFAERFDRCVRRVSFYVSQRVSDPEALSRIVMQIVIENPAFFTAESDDPETLRRLRASTEHLLALEAASHPPTDTPSFASEPDESAARSKEQA